MDHFYVIWSYVLTEAFWKHCMFLFFAMIYIFFKCQNGWYRVKLELRLVANNKLH